MKDVCYTKLILRNDDTNSFDFVIDVLKTVCDHDVYQAEQCAFITHFKGECEIKVGEKTEVETISDRLKKLGLSVSMVEC